MTFDAIDLGAKKIALRPQGESDRPFLLGLYASTREDELAPTGWPDFQKRLFIEDQFRLQEVHYRKHYLGASFDIILFKGQPVGRQYLLRGERDMRLIDMSILKPYRARGIGSNLLRALLAEAAAGAKGVSLHVDIFNPAQNLYRRLGFVTVETVNGSHFKMAWNPPS